MDFVRYCFLQGWQEILDAYWYCLSARPNRHHEAVVAITNIFGADCVSKAMTICRDQAFILAHHFVIRCQRKIQTPEMPGNIRQSFNCNTQVFRGVLMKCWMRMDIWSEILGIHRRLYCLISSRANVLFTFMRVLLVIHLTVIECATSILSMLWSVWLYFFFYPFHTFDCEVQVFYCSLQSLSKNLHPAFIGSFSPWYIGRSGIQLNLSQRD